MKTLLTFLLGIAIGVGAWFAYQRYYASDSGSTPDGSTGRIVSQSDARDKVVALARIQPASGIIEVAGVPGARLDTIDVKEGDNVTKGQVIGVLDTLPMHQMQLEALDAQIAEAEARLVAEIAVADQRIAMAKLNVEKAATAGVQDKAVQKADLELLRATLSLAEADSQRFQGLPSDLVSPMERAHQELVVTKSKTAVIASEVQAAKLEREIAYANRAARAELAASEAQIEQIRASIPIASLKTKRSLAEMEVQRATITAPEDGTILKVYVQRGETLANQPILQMADLDKMQVVAEVYKDDLKRIQLNDSATIYSNAFSPPFNKEGLQGRVVEIGRTVAGAGLQNVDPFAKADRHVVEVVVQLDSDGSREASRFVDLQVDALFKTATESASSAP